MWVIHLGMNISELLGQTLTEVTRNIGPYEEDEIHFTTREGKKYRMYHQQDCCESVHIEDINGDLQSLLGEEIRLAEETSHNADTLNSDSITWTFYHIATVKGLVTIRWNGTSNGYYSEAVDFIEE